MTAYLTWCTCKTAGYVGGVPIVSATGAKETLTDGVPSSTSCPTTTNFGIAEVTTTAACWVSVGSSPDAVNNPQHYQFASSTRQYGANLGDRVMTKDV